MDRNQNFNFPEIFEKQKPENVKNVVEEQISSPE